MKKRMIALIGAIIMLLSNMMLPVVSAYADDTVTNWSIGGESTEKELEVGYYKLIQKVNVGPSSQFDNATTSGSDGHYSCTASCNDDRYQAYHDGKNLTSCVGETATINISVDEPPAYINNGDEIRLGVSASYSASENHDSLLFYACQTHVDYSFGGYNADGSFTDGNGKNRLGIDRTWQYDDYYGASGLGNHFINIDSDNILRAKIVSQGSRLWIRIAFDHGRGEDAIYTYYFYEWVGGKTAETDIENKDKKEDSEDGYWELYEVSIPEQTENIPVNKLYKDSAHTITTFEDGKASACFTALKDVYNDSGELLLKNGDTASASIVFSSPEKRYYPGQTYSIDISAVSDVVTRDDPMMDICVGMKAGVTAYSGTTRIDNKDREVFDKSSTRKMYAYGTGQYTEYIGSSEKTPVNSGTLTGLIPYRNKIADIDDDSMWIHVDIMDYDTDGNMRIKADSIIYKYKWVKGKIKGTADIEDENDDSDGKGRKNRKDKDKLPEQSIFQLIETNATDRPGEDNGRSVIPAIIIGVSIAGAAVAAGTASSGKNKDNKKNDDPTYKMYIRKDFGDTIFVKAAPVKVYARIESSKGGVVSNEQGLTSEINISSETKGVNVNVVGIVSGAKCAEIQIPDNKDNIEECVIAFTYKGKGGIFIEKVKFKVVLQKHIEFIHIQENGQIKVMAEDERSFRSLFGHNYKINKYIRLNNFSEDAEDVKAIPPEGSGVSVNVTRTAPFTYWLSISENYKYTQFGKFPFDVKIDIVAYNKGEAEAKAVLTLKMYPSGIYVDTSDLDPSRVKEDHIEVNVCEFTDDKMLKFKPTLFRLYYATWGDDDDNEVTVREVCKDNPRISVLPKDDASEKILKKFEYGLYIDKDKTPSVLTLEPNRGLFQRDPNTKFLYQIKIEREHRPAWGEEGPDYAGSFMIRLLGKPDDDKTYDRRKEIDEIHNIIALNKLQENAKVQQLVQQLIEHMGNMSDAELKRRRRWIYDLSADLQNEEFYKQQLYVEYYEYGIKVVGTVRWLDDIAFSLTVKYILAAYGANTTLADAIIIPLKDLLFDAFGEWSANKFWGSGNPDYSFWSEVVKKIDSGVSSAAWSLVGSEDVNIKKVVWCIVGATIVNVIKNSYINYKEFEKDKKEIDSSYFWKVCRAVLMDLSTNALSTYISNTFVGNTCDKLLDKYFGKAIEMNKNNKNYSSFIEFFMKKGGWKLEKNATKETYSKILGEIRDSLIRENGASTFVSALTGGVGNFTEAYLEGEKTFTLPLLNDDASISVEVDTVTLKTLMYCHMQENLRLEQVARELGNGKVVLPEEIDYVHRSDLVEFYRRRGYMSEAEFLVKATVPTYVNPDVFVTGAERPTVDTGITIHRVAK